MLKAAALHDDIAPTTCLNCAAPLHGKYCAQCGQKKGTSMVSLGHFFHDLVHELAHLDGKIVRTLRLLFLTPGALTAEFLAGRRARYVGPIRLYLTASILLFTLLALSPPSLEVEPGRKGAITISATSDEPTARTPTAAPDGKPETPGENEVRARRKNFTDGLLTTAPRAMFVLLPVHALLLFLIFRRQIPFYVPHLYFSLHLHAVAFLVMSAVGLLNLVPLRAVSDRAELLLLLTAPYFLMAVRRVYAVTWGQALWRSALLALLYGLVGLAAIFGLVVFLMRKVGLGSLSF
jgi:hypothetical protein